MLTLLTRWLFAGIYERLDDIMTKQAEAVAQLQTIATELDKVALETAQLLVEIQTLKDAAAAGGDISPELQAAIDAVATRAQAVDAAVPDAPAV